MESVGGLALIVPTCATPFVFMFMLAGPVIDDAREPSVEEGEPTYPESPFEIIEPFEPLGGLLGFLKKVDMRVVSGLAK